MGKILVIGSSNTDMTILTSRFPKPGETIIGGTFLLNAGGKGANQAVAAARLGAEVTLITKLGNDVFGETALKNFNEEAINTSHVIIDPQNASGTALITVNSSGENTIVVAPGANDYLKPNDIGNLPYLLSINDILLMQLEVPLDTVVHAVQTAKALGRRVILNPAPATSLPDELLKDLFTITPNETEAQLITGMEVTDEATAKQCAHELMKRGVHNVVITLGSKGAWLSTDEHDLLIPAPSVNAVDTTAAGDVFNGALAHCLSLQSNFVNAVEYACKAAAISVTRIGAQASAPWAKEIN
ncbi:ribokinase [Mucilaginibacter sp. PAMB04168]|uniref:ribokinase n=1 Tax=Mucilaginibacter sp. PAMB04168 TaxID=3138567 RepID=UPI0031F70D7E